MKSDSFPFYFYFRMIMLLLGVAGMLMVHAEGTKELRPSEKNLGSLHLSKKDQFTSFAQIGTISEQQIKFTISDLSETIYFGLNNRKEGGDFISNIPFQIVSPSGKIFYKATMKSSGEGVVQTHAQALAGPRELGNSNGYDAKMLTPEEVGDYVLEFDISKLSLETELQIHLFDITIADKDSKPLNGRLFSKGWQLSTAKDSSFYGKVYPYTHDGVVYEVDLNKIKPYTFVITFNSFGTANTGDFDVDRKSKFGSFSIPEFPVFLNPPDEIVYPTMTKKVEIKSATIRKSCKENNFCLSYTTNASGLLEGYIDLNENGIEDIDGSDFTFSEKFDSADSKCVSWTGLNDRGDPVVLKDYRIYTGFSFGLINFPIYDAEHHEAGFMVKTLRPASSEKLRLYWDDSEINTGSTLDDPLVNLSGCMAETGCHKWKNRGDFDNDSQETINTWWYNAVYSNSFNLFPEQKLKISLTPDSLITNPKSSCGPIDITFYVFNEEIHFDTTFNNYYWYYNARQLSVNKPTLELNNFTGGEVFLEAVSKISEGCNVRDSISLELKSLQRIDIHPHDCGNVQSFVRISVNEKVGVSEFYLDSIPYKAGNDFFINPGTHHIYGILDSVCKIDTLIEVPMKKITPVIGFESEKCSMKNGQISVGAIGPNVRIQWENYNGKEFTRKNLEQGLYKFTLLDKYTNACKLDTFVIIEKVHVIPEVLLEVHPPTGRINTNIELKVVSPGKLENIMWHIEGNSFTGQSVNYRFETEGKKSVRVNVIDENGCEGLYEKEVNISENSDCEVKLANVFSPNNDGQNDFLSVIGNAYNFTLTVYNRVGNVVFQSSEKGVKWDGKYQGHDLPVSSYPYILNYTCIDENFQEVKKQIVGDVSILR